MDIKTNKDGSIEFLIDGCIGLDITVADVLNLSHLLESAPAGKMIVNSPGGYITEGWAMYNILAKFKDKLDVEVIGLAASMASVLALAGKSLVMRKGTYFMIHNPWSCVMGDSDDLRHEADILDKMKEDIITLYLEHTEMSRDELIAMMNAETWLSADEAMQYCFATSIDDTAEPAAACIGKMKFSHVPESIAHGMTPKPVPSGEVKPVVIAPPSPAANIENKEIPMTEEEKAALKAEIEAGVLAKIPAPLKLEPNSDEKDEKLDGWFKDYVLSKGKTTPAQNTTIKSTDGYGVPVLIDAEVYKRRDIGSIMRRTVVGSLGPRVKTVSADTKTTVKVGAAAEIIAEGADYPDNTDKGSTVTSEANKMGSIYSVTEETEEDTLIDVLGDFSDDAARALAKLENSYFFTGSGVDQPQGIVPGGTLAVTAASATAITYDELVDLDESIPEEYADGAMYFMSKSAKALIRKLKDNNGQPLLREFSDGGFTLFGKPVSVVSTMDAVAGGKKPICLGNRNAYGIFDRKSGLKVRISENTKNGDTEFRWSLRTDGRVIDATAFQYLAMKSA